MRNENKLDLLADGSLNLSILAPKIGVNYYSLWRACSGKEVGTAKLAKKIAKWARCDPKDVLDMWRVAIEKRISTEAAKM